MKQEQNETLLPNSNTKTNIVTKQQNSNRHCYQTATQGRALLQNINTMMEGFTKHQYNY